ncbi:fish-egg lectin-like [Scyliorhinus canicula]|uniref:fish-egg lectin-like n=1 Tax=Scyliorhinus canicula TaxID=7830 RepID=UPI0018F2973C|nr:fish-egg lectin-like [Scyliorhinus canicula]
MKWLLLTLLSCICFQECVSGLFCHQIDGNLNQIDAGNGQVFGVDGNGAIYSRNEGNWNTISGRLTHVTVGPAGVWGVDKNDAIYRMLGGSWALMAGLLKQIDSGGDRFVSGVNMNDDIFCAQRNNTISAATYDSPAYHHLIGKLKYYTCGPFGCWGVNSGDQIYFRTGVTPSQCFGTNWQQISGSLSMIEVGTDGSVYGVNSAGNLYRRDGITSQNPTGTHWTHINIMREKLKHVTTDLGQIWLITKSNKIFQCQ